MSINKFNTKDNVQLLWDLISEEEIFKFLNQDIQSNIYNVFINNIQGFFDIEKMNLKTLVELNKKYIVLILDYIRKNFPYQPSKIVIHNEQPVKELITYEEIQNNRKSKLEKDFTRRQEEFEDSMTLKAPPIPEFLDKEIDKPIKEMDKILKEIQAQRNYEVENINRIYNTSNQVDNWLKPQETSLKNEKLMKTELETDNSNNKFNYLNSLDSNLSKNNKKNVTFHNEDQIKTFNVETEQILFEDDDDDSNLFSKLKKVKKQDNIVLQIHEPTINEPIINEDRIAKLERNLTNLNDKMDKILDLLSRIN
jgi:hypothetical protein